MFEDHLREHPKDQSPAPGREDRRPKIIFDPAKVAQPMTRVDLKAILADLEAAEMGSKLQPRKCLRYGGGSGSRPGQLMFLVFQIRRCSLSYNLPSERDSDSDDDDEDKSKSKDKKGDKKDPPGGGAVPSKGPGKSDNKKKDKR